MAQHILDILKERGFLAQMTFPEELYEQLTGRKMFYNDDGTVMKLGADDPCPCGSGKKYRDCCGR